MSVPLVKNVKENNPKISIIVAVYNLEKYVLQCLKSIAEQTYKNYEVIVVNDGSKDESGKIVSTFITEHQLSEWMLIDKQNGGAAAARNSGIEVASGDWIFIVDGDDWLEPNCLLDLVSCIKSDRVDLVVGGFQGYDEITGEIEKRNDYPAEYGILPQDLKKLHAYRYSCFILFKKSIIDAHSLRYDVNMRFGEDTAWLYDYLPYVREFGATNKVVYTYRRNRGGSATNSLVHPKAKYHITAHADRFCDKMDYDSMIIAIKENDHFCDAMWSVLSSAVINDVLLKRFSDARKRRKTPFAKTIVKEYPPNSKKDKVFIWLWKHCFWLCCALIFVYYGNFETLRNNKIIKRLSLRKHEKK